MDTIDELLFNLRILGQVTRGRRINTTKQYLFVEDECLAQGVYRWKDGAGRDKCAERIVKEIKTLITISELLCEIVETNLNDVRVDTLASIKTVLAACIQGISNLCVTYDDPNFTGKVQATIDAIYKHLTVLDKLFIAAETKAKK